MVTPTDEESAGRKSTSAIDLLQGWILRGPIITVLQGFSGVGKSALIRQLITSLDIPVAYVVATETGLGLEDFSA